MSTTASNGTEQAAPRQGASVQGEHLVRSETSFDRAEILDLYDSVGWAAYTKTPEVLLAALEGSSLVLTVRGGDGSILGLARVLSDAATICYVQDILVRPEQQGSGVGAALFAEILERFAHVRQLLLLTDDEPGQRAFYERMGLRELRDFEGAPFRAFVRFATA
ncbi:GNAT family N-acetyltransferase [Humidisolicoccus flavus]|uniref:GNAT family N-acetyltransferase n=1 Tax=Humidisolicoccus flavus TaxID=3111414 RepID=UPI00324E8A64